MLNIMNLWGTLAMHIFLLQHWQSTDLIGKHGIMQRNFFFYFCLYMIHLSALHVLLSLNKFSINLQIPRKHYLIIKEVDCMPIQFERQCFQKGNIIRHHLKHKQWKQLINCIVKIPPHILKQYGTQTQTGKHSFSI